MSRYQYNITQAALICLCLWLSGCATATPTLPATPAPTAIFPTLTPGAFDDIVVATTAPNATSTPIVVAATPRPPTSTPLVLNVPDIEVPAALASTPCESFEVTSRASATQGYTLCGYVTVPESHAAPDNGRTLRLAVVIYKSPNPTAAPDPVLMAQGGPGGSTINLFGGNVTFLAPQILQSRDIVLIEQRGTRFSKPFLYCDEVEFFLMRTLSKPAGYEDVYEKQDALQRCADRLERDGVNLSAYNSVENANDMAYVTAALGYQQFNFYGVSYGALLGQHLLRLHPERLRSVVLDSVVPLKTNWIVEAPRSATNALKGIFVACALDAECNARYPNLESRFLAAVQELNRNPKRVLIQQESSSFEVSLTGDLFIRVLYDTMYGNAARIPGMIGAVSEGNTAVIESGVIRHAVTALAATNGMYMSTMCAEDGGYTDEEARKATQDLYPDMARVVGGTLDNDLLEICPVWQVATLPEELTAAVESDVPTLLLAGNLDPITPPIFAEEVARGLSRATLFRFPNQAHGLFFHSDCARRLMTQFILTPDAALDGACVAQAGQDF